MQAFDELVRVERADGEPLTAYTNLDRLEQHLKQLAPADTVVIDEFISAARAFSNLDLLGLAVAGPLARIRALRMLPLMLKYSRITLEQFAQRFKDPFLRRAFPSLIYDWPQTPMIMLLSFLGRSHIGDLGWPAVGSNAFAHAHRAALSGAGWNHPLPDARRVDHRGRRYCRWRASRGWLRAARGYRCVQCQRSCHDLRHAGRPLYQRSDSPLLRQRRRIASRWASTSRWALPATFPPNRMRLCCRWTGP